MTYYKQGTTINLKQSKLIRLRDRVIRYTIAFLSLYAVTDILLRMNGF